MYFIGMSIRDIVNHYEMMSIKISHMVVYKWIIKYSRIVENTLMKSSHRVFRKNTKYHPIYISKKIVATT